MIYQDPLKIIPEKVPINENTEKCLNLSNLN